MFVLHYFTVAILNMRGVFLLFLFWIFVTSSVAQNVFEHDWQNFWFNHCLNPSDRDFSFHPDSIFVYKYEQPLNPSLTKTILCNYLDQKMTSSIDSTDIGIFKYQYIYDSFGYLDSVIYFLLDQENSSYLGHIDLHYDGYQYDKILYYIGERLMRGDSLSISRISSGDITRINQYEYRDKWKCISSTKDIQWNQGMIRAETNIIYNGTDSVYEKRSQLLWLNFNGDKYYNLVDRNFGHDSVEFVNKVFETRFDTDQWYLKPISGKIEGPRLIFDIHIPKMRMEHHYESDTLVVTESKWESNQWVKSGQRRLLADDQNRIIFLASCDTNKVFLSWEKYAYDEDQFIISDIKWTIDSGIDTTLTFIEKDSKNRLISYRKVHDNANRSKDVIYRFGYQTPLQKFQEPPFTLKIVPNPASHTILVTRPNSMNDKGLLYISDLFGNRLELDIKSSSFVWELDISNLPPGVYSVIWSEGFNTFIGKFVKK